MCIFTLLIHYNVTKIQQTVARNLKHYRKVKGVHQWQLAEQTGIGQARLSRIENGQFDVGVQTIERLAEGLKISPSALLFDANEKENNAGDLFKQFEQLNPKDQKLIEILLESLLDKARLEELQGVKVKERLGELKDIRK